MTIPELSELLLGLTDEMLALSQERARLVDKGYAENDRILQEGLADIEQQVTIYPTDTWQEVIIKARILRQFGRTEDSVAAFQQYAVLFAETDVHAAEYSRMAVAFTRQAADFGLMGGVYVSETTTGGAAHTAGIRPGDILIGLQNQPVTGMDEVYKILLKLLPETPFSVEVLRLEQEDQPFQRLAFTLAGKPIGAELVPV